MEDGPRGMKLLKMMWTVGNGCEEKVETGIFRQRTRTRTSGEIR